MTATPALAQTPDAGFVATSPSTLAAITPDSDVGTAAACGSDGRMHAIEVSVVPPEMRRAGGGQTPWDLAEGSTMTGGAVGTVSGTVSVSAGRTITVAFKGGSGVVDVPENVPENLPVITVAPATPAALMPDAHVVTIAMLAADGARSAAFVIVGASGSTPPE